MAVSAARRAVERVCVVCCAHDVAFATLCVASIRYRYPDVPISLVQDFSQGPFETRDLESAWGVTRWDSSVTSFGWGFAKLEPLFALTGERLLILDADVVLAGPVLDRLGSNPADFVVSPHWLESSAPGLERDYFSLASLLAHDPSYRYPGYAFNTGQLVATAGLLQRADFSGLIEWSEPRRALRPDLFRHNDQGALNYVLHTVSRTRGLTIGTEEFMCWSEWRNAGESSLDVIRGEGYPYVIHWAGQAKHERPMAELTRADILEFFCEVHERRLRSL